VITVWWEFPNTHPKTFTFPPQLAGDAARCLRTLCDSDLTPAWGWHHDDVEDGMALIAACNEAHVSIRTVRQHCAERAGVPA
jgi:hypothetical protein